MKTYLLYWTCTWYLIGESFGYRKGRRHGHTLGYISGVQDQARAMAAFRGVGQ